MITGKWSIVIQSPMGAMDAWMDFTAEGETLTGTVEANGTSAAITRGKANGDEFDFIVNLKTPVGAMGFHVTGKVDGDNITGKAKMPMGSSPFTGTRA